MPPPIYTVALDYDDDGLFTGTGEDISADVLELRWRIGLEQPYDSLSAPSWAQITLRSRSQDYSPELVDHLLPGKRIRIRSTQGGTARTHFTGYIQRVEPLPGEDGRRTAVIHAAGPEAQIAAARLRLPPQINQRAHEILSAIIKALPLRPPILKTYWLLGLSQHSEIGQNTRLIEDFPRLMEAGITPFAFLGDTWGAGISGREAVRQVVEAERGRFFTNRLGELIFLNRHHLLLKTNPQAAFTDSMTSLSYQYGAEVVNRVTVRLHPRRVGLVSPLWTLDTPQRLQPGSQDIIAPFRDPDKRPMGALTIIKPVPGQDYSVNTAPDGSGTDHTAQVNIRVVQAAASAALLRIQNRTRQELFLQAGMQLRGKPILQGDPLTVEHSDLGSLHRFGLGLLRLDLPALGSITSADHLARFELARRNQPRGIVRSIQVSGTAHLTQMLARTLFDRITITESQTGHSGDYFIIAEEHQVDRGGLRHRVTWLLEPAAASAFWILGQGELDLTAILAY